MSKEKKLQIRNSTAEFLIFTKQAGENSIEVRIEDETVWLTQKLMAALFEVDVRTINEHLGNIYQSGEQSREATVRKFRIVQMEGTREVAREVEHYNLDAIIAVGFRVNSARATQFRQWATGVLRDFAIRGYVLDKERLKNGSFFNKEYFDNLLAEIREIRASERKFYQKITDIYATAMDYSTDSETTKTFIAFQIAWKLFQSRWNLLDWRFDKLSDRGEPTRRPRILFLADRNILADQAYNAFSAFPEDALR